MNDEIETIRALMLLMEDHKVTNLRMGDIELVMQHARPRLPGAREVDAAELAKLDRETMFAAGGSVPINLRDEYAKRFSG